MDFGRSDSTNMMDDDDFSTNTDTSVHGGQGQKQQHQHPQQQHQHPQQQQQGRQWPFDPQTGSASGSLIPFAKSPKPDPKTGDDEDMIAIPMLGQRWIGGYKITVNSPGSIYHDTEATIFRFSSVQHIIRYYDGTEETCWDADFTISRPREIIAEKEKPDGDVDDLEALMRRNSLK